MRSTPSSAIRTMPPCPCCAVWSPRVSSAARPSAAFTSTAAELGPTGAPARHNGGSGPAHEEGKRMSTESPRDAPWVMRTYSGHSTAKASNALYRANLAKGQTGLSIAFDLPTQTGYDPDSPEAGGAVGKVGGPAAPRGHMEELMAGIPVGEMNTSMTINATAAWLLGLYVAHAQDRGVEPGRLSGTTQNDIIKEYLSRGTFIFPPDPSLRLTVDTIAYTVRQAPKWNPINVCSYHLTLRVDLPNS